MLKMLSGLVARLKSTLHTHHAPAVVGTAWARHSRLRGVLNLCVCRECHLIRATQGSFRKAAAAVEKCQKKLKKLRERINDICGNHPMDQRWDAVDWDAVSHTLERPRNQRRAFAFPAHGFSMPLRTGETWLVGDPELERPAFGFDEGEPDPNG